MLRAITSGKYKKDLRLCFKRGYDLNLLESVINTLRIPAPLEEKNRPHPLTGQYTGYDECHITPDWLLIYKQTDTELLLVRTGTHSDLFQK